MLTGERGIGKTVLCQRVVDEARRRGFSCAGVISPALYDGQEKVGISLVDVASGDERPLASVDDIPDGVRWGRYSFVPSSLTWGSDLLARATPCDLLVIDELGPLELVTGRGLVTALDVLMGGGFALALVVVRPELVDQARERLKAKETLTLEVTFPNRERLPMHVLSLLGEEEA